MIQVSRELKHDVDRLRRESPPLWNKTSLTPRPLFTAEPTRGIWSSPIWGQTRCPIYRSGTFNVQRSTLNVQRGDRKGGWRPGYGDRHDVGPASLAAAHRYGDRHDVRYTDQEHSTCNVQLSTFNGVTEKAHGGPDMGTDTMLDRRVWRRHTNMGTGTVSDIPIRNVERPTFNSQLSMG